MRISIPAIHQHKNLRPLVALTAYTAPMARLLDPHVDILLVGDSLGMVLYGMESTLSVTLDMMIAHGKAVVKASQKACVVVDMPFGTYQASKEDAYRNAARIMAETGCSAVKLEGGEALADTVFHLTSRGIPVMGHIGLMPQYVHQLGGYRYQGRDEEDEAQLLRDALRLEEAGAFAMVLEGIREDISRRITDQTTLPTIGIGASPACDGQVLVIDDVLGTFTDFTPRFVKRYADISTLITDAVRCYADEVKSRSFPTAAHCFLKKEE